MARCFGQCHLIAIQNKTSFVHKGESDGSIKHLLEPEYHGDPVTSKACLCFSHFGWEMLGQMRESGFLDAYAVLFWSVDFGYLGSEQILFIACK